MNRKNWSIAVCALTCTAALTVYLKNLAPLELRPLREGVPVKTAAPTSSKILPQDVEITKSTEKTVVEAKKEAPPVKGIPGFIPRPEVIHEFKTLQAKIFKTDQDLAQLKKVRQNSALLFELAEYLRNIESVKNPEFRENQNIAIDILVEALKVEGSNAAETAIFEIIKDPQIENSALEMSTRESLAGVKADILYQASSLKPELFSQVESVLPGPVSQKIWKNIQQKQSENLAESESERQSRVAEISH
jgi:hypothetical protein